jgi:hypothetical protein
MGNLISGGGIERRRDVDRLHGTTKSMTQFMKEDPQIRISSLLYLEEPRSSVKRSQIRYSPPCQGNAGTLSTWYLVGTIDRSEGELGGKHTVNSFKRNNKAQAARIRGRFSVYR